MADNDDVVLGTIKRPKMKIAGTFDKHPASYEITLEDLCGKLKAAANHYRTSKANRLLFLNAEAALRALGARLEEADRELAELKNKPLIVGPGGAHVN